MRNKNKKRILLSLATAGLLVLSSATFFACGSKEKNKIDYEKDYDWSYVREFVDEHDEDMVIDGALSEERWQDKNYLQFTEKGITMKYTTTFTSYGLYIGAIVENDQLQWTGRYNFAGFWQSGSSNSAFGFKIQGPDVVEEHATTVFNFFVDAKNAASRNQTHFEAKATTNGDVEKGEATSMTAELFVSWDALNIEIDEASEYPEFVKIYPAYRYVDEPNSPNNKWLYPLFSEYGEARVLHRVRFNENGYINYDKEDATLGNAANGISKSDGWDLSQLSEEIVSSDTYHQQAIFFKGIESDSYTYTTKVTFTDESWGLNGHAGVCDMIDSEFFYAFYIAGYTVTKGTTSLNFHTLNFFRDGESQSNWHDTNEGDYEVPEGKDPYNDGIEITVIKQKEKFFYFIYDDLVLCKEVYQISGKTCPGLYTLSRKAIFTDYVVTDYENNLDGLNELIKQSAYKVEVPGNISGGSITSGTTALILNDGKVKEDLVINILPNSGYILTSFNLGGTIYDGESSYEFFSENCKEGVLVIPKEDIYDDVIVTAEYTYITRCGLSWDDIVTIKGSVKKSDGTSASNVAVFLRNEYATLCYKLMTTSSGNYSFTVPKAGTLINGVTVDGEYTLYVDGTESGYRYLEEKISVTESSEQELIYNFELSKLVVGGSAFVNNKTKISSVNGWNYNQETKDNLEVVSLKGNSIAYFTERVSKGYAIVETSIQNITDTTSGNYEVQPGIGFIVDNGTHYMALLLTGKRVTVLPDGNWQKAITTSDTNYFNVNSGYDREYKIRLLHYESMIALEILIEDVWETLYYTTDEMYNGACAYGFMTTSGGGKVPTVRFFDYAINTDTAKDEISVPSGKLTIEGNLTVTVKGEEKRNGDLVALGTDIQISYVNTTGHIAKIYANNVLLGILTENQTLQTSYTVNTSDVLLKVELIREYISQGNNLMVEDEDGNALIGASGGRKTDGGANYYVSEKIAEIPLRDRVFDSVMMYGAYSVTLNVATKNIAGLLIQDDYGNYITVRIMNDSFYLMTGNPGSVYRNYTLESKGVAVDDSYEMMIELREDRVMNFIINGVSFSLQFMDNVGHATSNLGFASNASKLAVSVIWTDDNTSFGFASSIIGEPIEMISTLSIEGDVIVKVNGVAQTSGTKFDFGTEYTVNYINTQENVAEIYVNGLLVASLNKNETFVQTYAMETVETSVCVVFVESKVIFGEGIRVENVDGDSIASETSLAYGETVFVIFESSDKLLIVRLYANGRNTGHFVVNCTEKLEFMVTETVEFTLVEEEFPITFTADNSVHATEINKREQGLNADGYLVGPNYNEYSSTQKVVLAENTVFETTVKMNNCYSFGIVFDIGGTNWLRIQARPWLKINNVGAFRPEYFYVTNSVNGVNTEHPTLFKTAPANDEVTFKVIFDSEYGKIYLVVNGENWSNLVTVPYNASDVVKVRFNYMTEKDTTNPGYYKTWSIVSGKGVVAKEVENINNAFVTPEGFVNSKDLTSTQQKINGITYNVSEKMADITLRDYVAGGEEMYGEWSMNIVVPSGNAAGLLIKDDKGNFIILQRYSGQAQVINQNGIIVREHTETSEQFSNNQFKFEFRTDRAMNLYIGGKSVVFYMMSAAQHSEKNLGFAENATKLEVYYIWSDDNTLFSEIS